MSGASKIHPSARCNTIFIQFANHFYVFGGEYFDGKERTFYNEMWRFDVSSENWELIEKSGLNSTTPAPRSSFHGVVIGEAIWIFGGVFYPEENCNVSKVTYFNDLWTFNTHSEEWNKVCVEAASSIPSPRCGHKLLAYDKSILLFGGFREKKHGFEYYNDLHLFDTENLTWQKINTIGLSPTPRSGFQFFNSTNGMFLYGGYTVNRVKGLDQGYILSDMFKLTGPIAGAKGKSWLWAFVKDGGEKPSQRSGCTITTSLQPSPVVFMFGGVFDKASSENEDDMGHSIFYNDIFSFDTKKCRWRSLCGVTASAHQTKPSANHKPARRKFRFEQTSSIPARVELGDSEDEEVSKSIDNIVIDKKSAVGSIEEPCGRMKASALLHNSTLYVYGGISESRGAKMSSCREIIHGDMYKICVDPVGPWQVVIPAVELPYFESDSSQSDSSCDDEDKDLQE